MSRYSYPLLVFILLSSDVTSPVLAAYRSQFKHYRENFDPAEADPRRNISCVGDSYGMKLPMFGNLNPNGVSMQKLCAKPQYGGGALYQHAGAYCYDPIDSGVANDSASDRYLDTSSGGDSDSEVNSMPAVMLGKVVFDPHHGARASPRLQNPRFLQACTYRCFCNYGLEDVSQQPLSRHFPPELWEADLGYQLQIDVDNDYTTSLSHKMGDPGRGIVDSLMIPKKPQIDSRGAGYLVHNTHMNLDPGNEIECTGELPNFNLPSPFSRANFSSTQELCAVTLSGGNKDANAGGYCHRSASIENTVWFSDSMTPRYEWTWGGGNFYAAASIRYFCWEHCVCKSHPRIDPETAKVWRFMSALQLRLHNDGSLKLEPKGQQGQNAATGAVVLPPEQQGSSKSPSGSCGANKDEFCPKAWDTAAWGPIPIDPPNVTDVVKPSPQKNGSMSVCGNKCNGPSDCGTTQDQYSCSCAFPSASDAHSLGLDPVIPVAICLALFSSAAKGGLKSLGGRDLSGYVDSRGLPHSCRCNETTVSDACCKSNRINLQKF